MEAKSSPHHSSYAGGKQPLPLSRRNMLTLDKGKTPTERRKKNVEVLIHQRVVRLELFNIFFKPWFCTVGFQRYIFS